jgi:hypothetical protein
MLSGLDPIFDLDPFALHGEPKEADADEDDRDYNRRHKEIPPEQVATLEQPKARTFSATRRALDI